MTRASFKSFSFRDVCNEFGHKDALLVDAHNLVTIDCMTEKVKISDFCNKKFKNDLLFVRGFADLEKDKVLCQFGHNVLLTVSCEGSHEKYCAHSSQKGCQQLQEFYAVNLELVHDSILRNGDVHNLHCYFTTSQKEDNSLKKK